MGDLAATSLDVIENQADARGHLPEQVGAGLLRHDLGVDGVRRPSSGQRR